jgi:hypothetical protein
MSRKKQHPSNNLPEPADDHDRKLLADVERHGWHVLGVEEDEEGPAFAYSIGLYRSFKHPEILVVGLPIEVMHRIINAVGEVARSGERFEHLDESEDVLDGHNVAFHIVERTYYPDYFGYARWLYRGDDFPALQCVWPDSQHRNPWHPEFGVGPGRQPLLSDDTSWPFHEGRNRAVFTTKPVLDGHPQWDGRGGVLHGPQRLVTGGIDGVRAVSPAGDPSESGVHASAPGVGAIAQGRR